VLPPVLVEHYQMVSFYTIRLITPERNRPRHVVRKHVETDAITPFVNARHQTKEIQRSTMSALVGLCCSHSSSCIRAIATRSACSPTHLISMTFSIFQGPVANCSSWSWTRESQRNRSPFQMGVPGGCMVFKPGFRLSGEGSRHRLRDSRTNSKGPVDDGSDIADS
jgi:hypothetical protein